MPFHVVYQFGTLAPENLVPLINRPDVVLVQVPNSTTVHVVMAEGHTDPPPGLDMPTARFYAFIVDPPDTQSHDRAITFIDSDEVPDLQAEEGYGWPHGPDGPVRPMREDPPLQDRVVHNPDGAEVPVWTRNPEEDVLEPEPDWTVYNGTVIHVNPSEGTANFVWAFIDLESGSSDGFIRREHILGGRENAQLAPQTDAHDLEPLSRYDRLNED